MAMRSIQFVAFTFFSAVAGFVAVQTTPSNAAGECRLTVAAEDGPVELAAMFATDVGEADTRLFGDTPQFIYAMNDIARDSEGATLVDVSDVTNCARRKNII